MLPKANRACYECCVRAKLAIIKAAPAVRTSALSPNTPGRARLVFTGESYRYIRMCISYMRRRYLQQAGSARIALSRTGRLLPSSVQRRTQSRGHLCLRVFSMAFWEMPITKYCRARRHEAAVSASIHWCVCPQKYAAAFISSVRTIPGGSGGSFSSTHARDLSSDTGSIARF
jgi:hypothetical protein